jgi:hypothetical protein
MGGAKGKGAALLGSEVSSKCVVNGEWLTTGVSGLIGATAKGALGFQPGGTSEVPSSSCTLAQATRLRTSASPPNDCRVHIHLFLCMK